MLTLDKVSVEIAGVSVLREVDVIIKPGEITSIVGRNGAGKTTLLRSLMGGIHLKAGSITLAEHRLDTLPSYKRASLGVGYAPQDRVIFPTMNVQENLAFPLQILGETAAQINERLEMVLDVVPQLKTLLDRSGASLSGGQGKMVALGRALMVGKQAVLLDEPFQGLAPVLANQYSQALNKLNQTYQHLLIIVTESNRALLKGIPQTMLIIERGELTLDSTSTTF